MKNVRSVRRAPHLRRSAIDANKVASDDWIAEDKVCSFHAAEIAMRSLSVIEELFSLWNYHSGSVGWSENPRYVKHHLELLSQMQQRAVFRDSEETVEHVKQLAVSL